MFFQVEFFFPFFFLFFLFLSLCTILYRVFTPPIMSSIKDRLRSSSTSVRNKRAESLPIKPTLLFSPTSITIDDDRVVARLKNVTSSSLSPDPEPRPGPDTDHEVSPDSPATPVLIYDPTPSQDNLASEDAHLLDNDMPDNTGDIKTPVIDENASQTRHKVTNEKENMEETQHNETQAHTHNHNLRRRENIRSPIVGRYLSEPPPAPPPPQPATNPPSDRPPKNKQIINVKNKQAKKLIKFNTDINERPCVFKTIPSFLHRTWIHEVSKTMAAIIKHKNNNNNSLLTESILLLLTLPKVLLTQPTPNKDPKAPKPRPDQQTFCRKKANSLLKHGGIRHISRSVQSLLQTPLAPLNEETIQRLHDLHPAPPADDPPYHIAPDQPPTAPIICDLKILKRIIKKKLDNGAAPGPSGWTGSHIAAICGDKTCLEGLGIIVTEIINGKIQNEKLKNLLLSSTLIPAGKPNNPSGVRPIAVGESFYKLAGHYALHLIKDKIPTLFPSIQHGVMSPGGSERVIHLTRSIRSALLNSDPEKNIVIIKTDFKNAFNTLSRVTAQKALRKQPCTSPLWPMFDWAYGSPSHLYVFAPNGEIQTVLQSLTGVKQGDPLASLVYSLTTQPIVESIQTRYKSDGLHILSILDDNTLIGPSDTCFKALSDFDAMFKPLNQTLSLEKCEILVHTNAINKDKIVQEAHSKKMKVHTDCLEMLGSLIYDNPTHAVNWLKNQIDKHRPLFDSLQASKELSKQHAFMILRHSALPRLHYLCRTLPPPVIYEACQTFDQLVYETFLHLSQLNQNAIGQSSDRWTQATLPINKSGLGLRSTLTTSPLAYLSALIHSIPDLLKYLPDFRLMNDTTFHQEMTQVYSLVFDAVPPHHTQPELFLQLSKDKVLQADKQIPVLPALEACNLFLSMTDKQVTINPHPHTQKKLQTIQTDQTFNQLDQVLDLQALEHESTHIKSLCTEKGIQYQWLLLAATNRHYTIHDDDFTHALQARLGQADQFTGKCPACNMTFNQPNQGAIHIHTCNQSGSLTLRHEVMKDAVYGLCKLIPSLIHVEKEPLLHPHLLQDPSERDRSRGDLLLRHATHGDVMVDVSGTHPLGQSMWNRQPNNQPTDPQLAVNHVERQKFKKYNEQIKKAPWLKGLKFFPMVFDVFGQLSPATHQFLTWLTAQLKFDDYLYGYETPSSQFDFTSHMYNSLSVSLIRANALVSRRATALQF